MRAKLRDFGGSLVRSWSLSLTTGVLLGTTWAAITAAPGRWWIPLVWACAVLYIGYRAALAEADDYAPWKVLSVGGIVGGLLAGCYWALAGVGGEPGIGGALKLLSVFQPGALLGERIGDPIWLRLTTGVGFLAGMHAVGVRGKARALYLAKQRERPAEAPS
jgi:hypothetical protein